MVSLAVWVTALPCKILMTTLFMFTCIKQLFYVGRIRHFLSKFHENNFKRIVPDEYYLFISDG